MWLAAPIFLVLAVGAVFAWRRVLDRVDAIAYGRRDDLMQTLMKQS